MASLDATSTTVLTAYPTTPSYSDDLDYITAYLDIHVLSDPSMVYAFVLWIVLAAIVIVYTVSHWTGLRGGYIGALWVKWAVRRRTWRKKHSLRMAKLRGEPHRQPLPLPSNAQLLTLVFLVIATLALAFVGPDYFAPRTTLLSVSNTSTIAVPRSLDTSTLAQYQPDYTISKAWWTSGDRTGLIAFALFPLCVLLALKAPPFAILAVSYLMQLHFDKLAWLHKWIGRLIYLLTLLHVALWSVELAIDKRDGADTIMYVYAWGYTNFRYGWVAFISMTLLVAVSFRPIRRAHYETFYFMHVLLVPLTLIFSALHHPPVWWWCWGALALWAGERIWRLVWYLQTNGYIDALLSPAPPKQVPQAPLKKTPSETWEMSHLNSPRSLPKLDIPSRSTTKVEVDLQTLRANEKPSFRASGNYVPPLGFAHAELLPGRTVRLRLITAGFLSWAPGQHFLLRIPAISRLSSHPFTAATVCDQEAPTDEGRELVFLVRAKNGWTKRLWDIVAHLISRGERFLPDEGFPADAGLPVHGTLLRAYVDGAYGSAVRARWGDYSTALIIAGGSGVSFALSTLQYLCLCLAGRDGYFLGGKKGGWGHPNFKLRRVHFVWLIREFSHIQWCASILRRCLAMVPAPELQIDIFVTNVASSNASIVPLPGSLNFQRPQSVPDDDLAPPSPLYARESMSSHRPRSSSSDGESDTDTITDLSYYSGGVHENSELGHEEHVLDLTNFEGDDDTALPGETQFNLSVKREGRLRRAASQKLTKRRQHASIANFQSTVRLVEHPQRSTSPVRVSIEETPRLISPVTPSPLTIGSAQPFLSNPPLSFPGSTSSHDSNPPSSFREPGRKRHRMSPIDSTTTTTLSPSGTRRFSMMSQQTTWSDAGSLAALVSEAAVGMSGEHIRLELDESEMHDVAVVAEHARPGKPRLDRVLAEEVAHAEGPIIVGCCGPLSLNAVVRKTIAAQIDPERIRGGDMSGSITLISEEYEY